jgi:DNA-binding SARP family transcriptional activator
MLATSDDGERARPWLQDKLWGSRGPKQARGSLRQELASLRRQINTDGAQLLVCRRDCVALDLDR